MASAEAFYFTAEFEVFPDLVVVEDAEAVYDRGGGACRFDDVFGVKVEVFTVSHCEDDGVGTPEGGRQVFRYSDVLEALLVSEKACPAGADGNGSRASLLLRCGGRSLTPYPSKHVHDKLQTLTYFSHSFF